MLSLSLASRSCTFYLNPTMSLSFCCTLLNELFLSFSSFSFILVISTSFLSNALLKFANSISLSFSLRVNSFLTLFYSSWPFISSASVFMKSSFIFSSSFSFFNVSSVSYRFSASSFSRYEFRILFFSSMSLNETLRVWSYSSWSLSFLSTSVFSLRIFCLSLRF